MDQKIQETEPFKVVKVDEKKGMELIIEITLELNKIAEMLEPLLPGTSENLKKLIRENKKPVEPLFPRKN